ncbi:hypothetical protein JB92DRAFT_2840981 [Gautieria morchelliformis]|nr:hypothetical protein JB92DRAFT_2840981 [Gautieria morchelliformis]
MVICPMMVPTLAPSGLRAIWILFILLSSHPQRDVRACQGFVLHPVLGFRLGGTCNLIVLGEHEEHTNTEINWQPSALGPRMHRKVDSHL